MYYQITYTIHQIIFFEGEMNSLAGFDAWGSRRNADWTTVNVPSSFIFDRGFTSHEHLDEFGLINMNGRVYDDAVGRFLSPDPFVQMPDNAQNFNRYSYCLNNPLIYTDPDGEIIIPLLIGAGIGILTNGIGNSINNKPFFQGALKAGIIGGIGGVASFGIGQAVSGLPGLGKLAVQTLAHGHLGGAMSAMNGGTYGQGFLSGAAGSFIGGGTGTLLQNADAGLQAFGTVASGSIAGGVGAEIMGGNFWEGAMYGAISSGLNHAYHRSLKPKIFVDNFDESLDFGAYEKMLEKNLIGNGFSKRLDVVKSTVSGRVWNWAKGNPAALVWIKDSYTSGAPLDRGVVSYAKPGSNFAKVYGKMPFRGSTYSPSITDLVNVTTHELGHAIFSFTHSGSGIMRKSYNLGSDLIPFTYDQYTKIFNSIWGVQ